ncbi:MAG: hypothetical protein AAGU14_06875 [Eubacteriaceae bacterium]
MKKCIAIIIALSICIISLTGCGTKASFNLTAQIDQQVIYDQNGVVIKALSLETKTYKDSGEVFLALNVYAENNSAIEVLPTIHNISINGILTCTNQGNFYLASSSNKDGINKRNGYFILGYVNDASGSYKYFGDMGITDVSNISFDLVMTKTDLFDPNTPGKNALSITPISLQTNIADKYKQEKPNPQGQVIYDQDNIKITTLGLEKDYPNPNEVWCSLLLFVENNSENRIMLKAGAGTKINEVIAQYSAGWMYPLSTIPPGKCAYIRMRPSFFGVNMSAEVEKMNLIVQINSLDNKFNVINTVNAPSVEIKLK